MASRGINKVILVGNLGQDPEVRFMPSGGAVANITIATSDSWRDKQTGEQKEKTEWHRVVLFGKLAEVAGEYLKKGSKVYIEGQLQTRKWQNQQGQDQYTTEVVVQGYNGIMQMLDSRQGGGFDQQGGGFGGQNNMQQGGFQQNQQRNQNQGGFQQQGGFGGQNQGQSNQNQGGFQQQNSGFSSNQNQGGFGGQNSNQGQSNQQGGGFQQNQQSQPQSAKVNPQEPTIDFDDDIPF